VPTPVIWAIGYCNTLSTSSSSSLSGRGDCSARRTVSSIASWSAPAAAVICFSQVFGGRSCERFQSGIGETPSSVAMLAMERAAEAGTTVGSQATRPKRPRRLCWTVSLISSRPLRRETDEVVPLDVEDACNFTHFCKCMISNADTSGSTDMLHWLSPSSSVGLYLETCTKQEKNTVICEQYKQCAAIGHLQLVICPKKIN